MPRASYPSLEWFNYHLTTKEWHKAVKDLGAMWEQKMLDEMTFRAEWEKLANAMLEARA